MNYERIRPWLKLIALSLSAVAGTTHAEERDTRNAANRADNNPSKDVIHNASTKRESWRESDRVRVRSDFNCGANTANVDYLAENGLTLSVSVNGSRLPDERLQAIKDHQRIAGAFEFVAFVCSDQAYSFMFHWPQEGSTDHFIIFVEGKLEGVGR